MRTQTRVVLTVLVLFMLAPVAVMQEKGGQDPFGPYEVVPNWPKPLTGPENEGWT